MLARLFYDAKSYLKAAFNLEYTYLQPSVDLAS